MRLNRIGTGAALSALLLLGVSQVKAQVTVAKPTFSISFGTGWDTTETNSSIVSNSSAFQVATMGATPGTGSPNIDSMLTFYSDSLGGHLTKGKDSSLTLGSYSVHWQDVKYDSLPKLTAMIKAQMGPLVGSLINLKNGTFRVYYLQANGYEFSIAAITVRPNAIPSYADIEAAIKTLKLGVNSAIRELAVAWGGTDIWVREGRLGGAWFSAHKPVSISCYNLRGAWMGPAIPSGSQGIWVLPSAGQNAFLQIVLPDGSRYHLAFR